MQPKWFLTNIRFVSKTVFEFCETKVGNQNVMVGPDSLTTTEHFWTHQFRRVGIMNHQSSDENICHNQGHKFKEYKQTHTLK